MISEDTPAPPYNVPVLTIAQIIKSVMSSAAKSELADLYICAKQMFPLCQALVEMGLPQSWSPIQCDNVNAIKLTKETIIPLKTNTKDVQFHWLRCQDSQVQFCYYWAPGPNNLGDYSIKNHTPIYHLSHRKIRQIHGPMLALLVKYFSMGMA